MSNEICVFFKKIPKLLSEKQKAKNLFSIFDKNDENSAFAYTKNNLRRTKTMRIDKFLKVSRLLKRRTVANDACNGGRVSVNGKEVKPSYKLKIGDVVELSFGGGVLKFRVLELKETVRKEEAQNLYEIISE